MRAIVFDGKTRFSDNHPDPIADGECLIRIHKAGICSTDIELTKGYMGFTGVLGHEWVGTVEDGPAEWLGKRVTGEICCVCGECDMCRSGLTTHCRQRTVIGIDRRDGCFADLMQIPARNLHEIPEAITDEQATFIEPLAAAYQVLKQFPIDPKMNVAVIGTGRLGLLIAQVLAHTGCSLQGIGRNEMTLAFLEKHGIQPRNVKDVVPRMDCDVVVEVTGTAHGLELAQQMVRPRGTIILKSTFADSTGLNLAPTVVNEITILGSRCGPFNDAILALARGDIDVTTMISRTYPIERGIEAMEAATDPSTIKVLLDIS